MRRATFFTFFSMATVTFAVGCTSPDDGGSSNPAQGDDQDVVASRATMRVGQSKQGTFRSASATRRVTFLAQKGWNITLMVRSESCGDRMPNGFGCKAAFAARAVVSFGDQKLDESAGDMKTSGTAFGGFIAPETGLYSLEASVADWDGHSPLKYLIAISPPDLECQHKADCEVQMNGKNRDVGLECARSAFPDEDGDGTFCQPKGSDGSIVVP